MSICQRRNGESKLGHLTWKRGKSDGMSRYLQISAGPTWKKSKPCPEQQARGGHGRHISTQSRGVPAAARSLKWAEFSE